MFKKQKRSDFAFCTFHPLTSFVPSLRFRFICKLLGCGFGSFFGALFIAFALSR